MPSVLQARTRRSTHRPPRLGFLGLGWIGRARLQSLVAWGGAEIAAIADPSAEACETAQDLAPDAVVFPGLDRMLEAGLDGVVVATPPALHERHVAAALAHGIAVFCQKPLATTRDATQRLVTAAGAADRLLYVDMSYRRAQAFMAAEDAVRLGAVGEAFAVEAAFHNPHRPARQWSSRLELSGGGCLLDLGTHLVDLALAALGPGEIASLTAALYVCGSPVTNLVSPEDYATVTFRLDSGRLASVVTSWEQVQGDPEISVVYRGSSGSVQVRNVGGSFYDFEALLSRGGGRRVPLSAPPDAWGGRLLVEWATRLAQGDIGYDPAVEDLERVAHVIDRSYGRVS